MSYREYLPHPALRNYIDAYWTVNLDHQAVPGTTRILPDCCTDLIFNRGNTIYNGNQHAEMVPEKSYLVGTMTTYKDTLINPGTATLGIRFRPGGIGAFYKLNQYELTDLAVPYQDKQLAELVWAGTDVIQNINRYFLQKLPVKPGVLSFLINDMYQVKGQLRIPELTGKYHMSERKLERLFKTEVGVTVKGLAKLIRFTHTLAEIRDPARQHSLTQIAYQAGYYDQAHLCNDVKAYTGLTAAQL
jgi:AraC-like DNA-binding protein